MTTHSFRGTKPNLAGEKFGYLMVIGISHVSRKGQHWSCVCSNCGRKSVVVTTRLLHLDGRTGCRSCSNLKSPCGKLTRTFWHQVMYAAKLGGRKLEVTMKEAWQVFEQQGGKCALTGIDLILSPRKGESTASLDRIDSSQDYIMGNVQWVHKDINKMKTDLDQERFITMCQAVARHFSVS